MIAMQSLSRHRCSRRLAMMIIIAVASFFVAFTQFQIQKMLDAEQEILLVPLPPHYRTQGGQQRQPGNHNQQLKTNVESCDQPRTISLEDLPKTLPKPFLHLGMPKTGTTTLEAFFKCGGVHTSHSLCKVTNDDLLQDFYPKERLGRSGLDANGECLSNRVGKPCERCQRCMWLAKNRSLPLLESCGDYEAYTQMDTIENGCHYPQLMSLDLIHEESPSATFLYMFRDVNSWINSVSHFRGGSTIRRFRKCAKIIPFLKGNSPDNLRDFRCNSVKYVRNFVAKHPSHTLIEIDLDSPETGKILSKLFHIDEKCWGKTNVNPKLHNTTG